MIQPDEHQHHTIWTPELIEITMPLAGVGRRCLAMLLDQGILLLVTISWYITLGIITNTLSQTVAMPSRLGLFVLSLFLAPLFFYLVYFFGFHTLNNGQTPGKMALGIRVVTERGGKPGVLTFFIRAIFDMLDWILFYGGLSVLMILMTKQEKRIADFAAGTIVILDR